MDIKKKLQGFPVRGGNGVKHHFQQNSSYIVVGSFIGGRNLKKPRALTC